MRSLRTILGPLRRLRRSLVELARPVSEMAQPFGQLTRAFQSLGRPLLDRARAIRVCPVAIRAKAGATSVENSRELLYAGSRATFATFTHQAQMLNRALARLTPQGYGSDSEDYSDSRKYLPNAMYTSGFLDGSVSVMAGAREGCAAFQSGHLEAHGQAGSGRPVAIRHKQQ